MRSLTFILVLISQAVFGQNFSFHIGSGVGTYDMSALKKYEKDWSDQFAPLAIKRTDNFEAGLYYDVQIRKNFESGLTIGIAYRRMTSGIRSSYEDYSGFIEHQQRTDANSIGVVSSRRIVNGNRISLDIGLQCYYTTTSYKIDQMLTLSGSPSGINDSLSTNTNSVILNPFFEGHYALGIFIFSMNVGYSYDFKGKTQYQDINTDWSGVRAGLAAGVKF